MARQLSQAAFRAMFMQETEEVFLMGLTLSHPDWQSPVRVVYNNQPITRSAGTYQPAVFDVNLPEDTDNRVPEVTLTIENIDRAITDLIRNISGRISVVMEVILASSPNTVEAGPFNFEIVSCTYDALKVSGTLSFEEDVLNTEFPGVRYTPGNSPGLFR